MELFEIDSQFVAHEKEKARELRKSRWWQNKLQNATCYYCNLPLKRAEATMDHMLPISKGGRSTKSNVVISCKTCNNKKKDLSTSELEAFLASIPK